MHSHSPDSSRSDCRLSSSRDCTSYGLQVKPDEDIGLHQNKYYFVISREVLFATTVRNFAELAIHSLSCAFVAARSRKAARRSGDGVLIVMR